jgi:putative flavoprotein involved in K+ transport
MTIDTMEVDQGATADVDPVQIASDWLAEFVTMIDERDPSKVVRIFAPEGGWRDLVAVSWDLQTAVGHDALRSFVSSTITTANLVDAHLTDHVPAQLTDTGEVQIIEASFELATDVTRSRGIVRLVPGAGGNWIAFTVSTDLVALDDAGAFGTQWDDVGGRLWNEAIPGNLNWADSRDATRPFPTTAPTVLMVGAGQAGLQTAAHLRRLGVQTYIIERHKTVGDSWRLRHYNLITHTPAFADHFALMPFPKSWPISMQKDKLANWIEAYAETFDLDVWTDTECLSASFDTEAGHWTVEVRRPSGNIEVLHPTHFVMATGLMGGPKRPSFPHLDSFAGTAMHSADYHSSRDAVGKKVVVVGSGASAHDIAQDLIEQGCTDVTLVQRSSTYVMSYARAVMAAYAPYYGPDVDLDIADLKYKSTPMPILVKQSDAFTDYVAELDAELLQGLNAAGFRTNNGGLLRLSLTPYLAGYYINQGCSDLIIDGTIKMKAGEVVDFDEAGVRFADSSRLDADLVILCTGYYNAREIARQIINDEVAEACSDAWVLDYDRRGGEHGLLWGETGYQNLWFAAGGLHQSRLYSPYLALKIAAVERGLVTAVGRHA